MSATAGRLTMMRSIKFSRSWSQCPRNQARSLRIRDGAKLSLITANEYVRSVHALPRSTAVYLVHNSTSAHPNNSRSHSISLGGPARILQRRGDDNIMRMGFGRYVCTNPFTPGPSSDRLHHGLISELSAGGVDEYTWYDMREYTSTHESTLRLASGRYPIAQKKSTVVARMCVHESSCCCRAAEVTFSRKGVESRHGLIRLRSAGVYSARTNRCEQPCALPIYSNPSTLRVLARHPWR